MQLAKYTFFGPAVMVKSSVDGRKPWVKLDSNKMEEIKEIIRKIGSYESGSAGLDPQLWDDVKKVDQPVVHTPSKTIYIIYSL